MKTFYVTDKGTVPPPAIAAAAASPTRLATPPTTGRLPDLSKRAELEAIGHMCTHRLTISEFDDHSAKTVCQSDSSSGPDFISTVERLFCDMCDRQIWRLCDHEEDHECFDLELRILKAGSGSRIFGRDGMGSIQKRYRKVGHWKD
jgi:hypothetical protein